MLQLAHPQVSLAASAMRSVSIACVNGSSAPVSFYFGYWFSHWLA